MKLDGNTILITGGTSGMGLELAKELVNRNNVVIVTGRDRERLERAKNQLPRLHTIQSDASRIEDVDSLFTRVTKEFPALNVVVNNASVRRTIDLQDEGQDLEQLTGEVDINFKGQVWTVARFLPHLKRMPGAAVVYVSSVRAFVPLPSCPIYSATKAAINSFSRSSKRPR
jgi:uncharacterized oxidoreductase